MKINLNSALLFTTFFLVLSPTMAQKDTNYWHYHELIYKAECALFDKHDVDACFQYYDQAFNNFEFNYAHDLVNAAQLAHYYHRDYMKYLKRAVLFGVRPMHLKYIPAWKSSFVPVYKAFLSYYRSEDGQTARQQYLATINQEYLAWVYQLKINDMKYRRSGDKMYLQRFSQWDEEFLKKVKEYGFPGAKLIGIDDSLLYKELQNDALNFNLMVKMKSDSLCLGPKSTSMPMTTSNGETIWIAVKNQDMDCPEISYGYLAQQPPIVYLTHHPCPLKVFEATYDEIAKGNLHPREYAQMLDHAKVSHSECDCNKYINMFFRIGNMCQKELFEKYFISEDETDALRKQYWIIPLRVEQAKAQFGIEQGYRFNWGWNNNYSFQ